MAKEIVAAMKTSGGPSRAGAILVAMARASAEYATSYAKAMEVWNKDRKGPRPEYEPLKELAAKIAARQLAKKEFAELV